MCGQVSEQVWISCLDISSLQAGALLLNCCSKALQHKLIWTKTRGKAFPVMLLLHLWRGKKTADLLVTMFSMPPIATGTTLQPPQDSNKPKATQDESNSITDSEHSAKLQHKTSLSRWLCKVLPSPQKRDFYKSSVRSDHFVIVKFWSFFCCLKGWYCLMRSKMRSVV